MNIRNACCLLWTATVLSTLVMMKPVEVHAQVILLPTTRTFSVGTSVSVPDRGFIGLGGIRYGALGRTSYGTPGMGMLPLFGVSPLFHHRATSQTLGSTQAVLGVQIIDLKELDRQVLQLGGNILRAKQAAGLLPVPEKELPNRIPVALRNSFSSPR
ncbi:MAG: hypothetical protein ACKVK0_09575 [Pirellulales bacterium]|jgi:hypothetical protein